MSEKTVTVTELSKILKLNAVTLRVFLCRFGKYVVNNDVCMTKYKYKFNYFFLDELQKFFISKLKHRNGMYFKKYNPVVQKLEKLKQEV